MSHFEAYNFNTDRKIDFEERQFPSKYYNELCAMSSFLRSSLVVNSGPIMIYSGVPSPPSIMGSRNGGFPISGRKRHMKL